MRVLVEGVDELWVRVVFVTRDSGIVSRVVSRAASEGPVRLWYRLFSIDGDWRELEAFRGGSVVCPYMLILTKYIQCIGRT